MRELLNQIKKGLNINLYFLALFVSLVIPDICGALDSEDGEATGQKYKNWFDKYVAPKYNGFLSGADCYYFRCSLLHQGTSQNSNSRYSRILFIEPGATTNILHNNILNDVLNIDVQIFCRDIILGAEEYLNHNEGTELYERNYDKFIRRHPDGLLPYIAGVPVIS
ncbi:MAG: hypothetical protein PHV43_01570 [Candidatus Colwellbacteria bacterium]|nr:hypothetical protein [Candidatus Colwellbacteria bacterium]